jgi:hypothetical protein
MLLIYNNDLKRNCVLRKNQEITIKNHSLNILGQRLISVDKVTDLDTIEIPFNVQRGAYIVKVNTNRGTIKILKQ